MLTLAFFRHRRIEYSHFLLENGYKKSILKILLILSKNSLLKIESIPNFEFRDTPCNSMVKNTVFSA